MTFKSNVKRLGYGENLRGMVNQDGKIVLCYRGKDDVVRVKTIESEGSGYAVKIIGEYGANIAQPLFGGKLIRVQGSTTIGISDIEI